MANGNQQQGGGFMDQVGQGLLEVQRNPLFNTGLGLLAAAGPTQQPMSTGQRLVQGLQTGVDLQSRARQNEAQRQEMLQRQRQQQAQQSLLDLMQEPVPPEGIRRPGFEQDRQQEMMGLLAEANPDAFSQGLLGQMMNPEQERAEPSALRMIRALEDPTLSRQQRDMLRQQIEGSGASDQMLQQMDMMMRMMEMQQMRNEMERTERDERRQRAETADAFRQDLSDAKKLARLNNQLQDTALETGIPMSDLRRQTAAGIEGLKSVIGLGDEQAQETIADFDEFTKTATRFASQTANRLFDAGGLTNQQLRQAENQTPSASLSPRANNRIIADQLETMLRGADRANVELSDQERRETRNLIEQLREGAGTGENQSRTGGGQTRSFPEQVIPAPPPSITGEGGQGGAAGQQTETGDDTGGPDTGAGLDAVQTILGQGAPAAGGQGNQRQRMIQQAEDYIRNAEPEALEQFAGQTAQMPQRLRQAMEQRLSDLGF